MFDGQFGDVSQVQEQGIARFKDANTIPPSMVS